MENIEQVMLQDEIFFKEMRRDRAIEQADGITAINPELADEYRLEALKAHQSICDLEVQLYPELYPNLIGKKAS